MRRKFVVAILGLICVLCSFGLIACDVGFSQNNDTDTTCTHTYGQWESVVCVSCTSMGYNIRTCETCGKVEEQFVEATGHTYVAPFFAIAPAGGEDGINVYTCLVCGNAKIEIVNGTLYDISGVLYKTDTDNDSSNDIVIANVEVTLTDSTGNVFTCTTDENGRYVFQDVVSGNYTISCVVSGYNDLEYVFSTEEDSMENLTKIYMDVEQQTTIQGSVSIADLDLNLSNNFALNGAKVTIIKQTGTNVLQLECLTDADGKYSFDNLPVGIYKLKVEKEGYIVAEQIINVEERQSSIQNMEIEIIEDIEDEQLGVVSGTILDAAVQGEMGISGITLQVREGINNVNGEILLEIVTDAKGNYVINSLEAGNYTVYIVDNRELENESLRYTSAYFNVKIIAGETISDQNGSTSNNAEYIDAIQVKLTWGSSPSDLDSHLTGPTSSGRFHVYYNNKTSGEVANLDRDDTDSYGPETTTINLLEGVDGVYRFSVHNFTNRNSSYSEAMAQSGAKVEVFVAGALRYTFYVPDDDGTLWTVFEYDCTTGFFTTINEMSYHETAGSIS